jgi:positive regulator of sigma E activity
MEKSLIELVKYIYIYQPSILLMARSNLQVLSKMEKGELALLFENILPSFSFVVDNSKMLNKLIEVDDSIVHEALKCERTMGCTQAL